MDEIERLARAICTAAGDDPDARVFLTRQLPVTTQGRLILQDGLSTFAGWVFYTHHARGVLDFNKRKAEEQPVAEAPFDRPRGSDW